MVVTIDCVKSPHGHYPQFSHQICAGDLCDVTSPVLSPSPELLRLTREYEGGAIMIQRERVTNIVMGSGNCHDVMIHDTKPVMS